MLNVSSDNAVQKRYEEMIRKGESHNMALMLATRTPCGTNQTDRALWDGRANNHGIDDDFNRVHMLRRAKRAGIDIAGKVYVGQLADRRGVCDPAAWVSDTSDIRKVCEKRGYGCEGLVKVRAAELDPTPTVRLAEDLVQEKMQQALMENPGRAAKLGELREEVIEKHGQAETQLHKDAKKKKKSVIRKV